MFLKNDKRNSKNVSAGLKPWTGSQGGMILLIVFIGIALLAGVYASVHHLKKQKAQAPRVQMKKQAIGKRCERALKTVVREIELEKKAAGKYPYEFTDEFLNGHKAAVPLITNLELWTRESDNTLALDTAYGDSYTLTGYCRDGRVYQYDSLNNSFVSGFPDNMEK